MSAFCGTRCASRHGRSGHRRIKVEQRAPLSLLWTNAVGVVLSTAILSMRHSKPQHEAVRVPVWIPCRDPPAKLAMPGGTVSPFASIGGTPRERPRVGEHVFAILRKDDGRHQRPWRTCMSGRFNERTREGRSDGPSA